MAFQYSTEGPRGMLVAFQYSQRCAWNTGGFGARDWRFKPLARVTVIIIVIVTIIIGITTIIINM